MNPTIIFGRMKRTLAYSLCFIGVLIFPGGLWSESLAATLEERYPGLVTSVLKSAVLESLEDDTLLAADSFTVKRSELLEKIEEQDVSIRGQLEKSLILVLEQETLRRLLLEEARKEGFASSEEDKDRMIQDFFEYQTSKVTVSDGETRALFAANQEMMGGASFEEVSDGIRQYLLQEKRQRAAVAFVDSLGGKVRLRINEKFVESQNHLAMDNPVDVARRSGKPTLVEFGATGCVPCDMMQPILDKLRKDYPEQLNVVFVHVGEEQILAARYGIRSIPVQVFFDAQGKEVFRHVGFFPQPEMDKQLVAMGIQK